MSSVKLSGSVLGVSFDVTVTEVESETLNIVGSAGGFPVSIMATPRAKSFDATGLLLGNPFVIAASEAV